MTFDLSTKMDFIYDQGSIGSCVSNSACWILRFHKMAIMPSRLYHYYYCRLFDYQQGDNRPNIDDGTTVQQSFRVLNKKGVCTENLYPYITSKQGLQPPKTLDKNASFNRVIQYAPVQQNIQSMKNLLKLGYPFSFGILVYQSFMTNAVTRKGLVPMPQSGERILGGHALTAVGYDDNTQMIKFVNSWGRGWGNRGYGFIPYAYLENGSLSGDFWTMYRVNMQIPRMMKKRRNIKNRVNPITYALWLRKHKN
jgi:C1A family cysteine protease